MVPKLKKKQPTENIGLLRNRLKESTEAIRKLKAERDILIEALDAAGVGVTIESGKGGRWKSLNESISRITGYKPEEVSSSRDWARKLYADPATRRQSAAFDRRFHERRRRDAEDFPITTRGGENRSIRFRKIPVKTGPKDGHAILNVISDITEIAGLRSENDYCKEWAARMFDHAVDGVCILDGEMTILRANRGAFAKARWNTKDLVGKSLFSFITPHFIKKTRRFFQRVIRKGSGDNFRTQLVDKLGREVDVELSAVRAKDPDGNLSHIIVNIHDITGMIEGTQVSKRLGSVVESSPVAIIELNTTNHITYTNSAFGKLLGHSRSRIIGKHIRVLYHRPVWEEVEREIKAALRRKGQWMGEAKLRRKDRSIFPAEMRMSVIYSPEGKRAGYTAFLADITARKMAEAARAKRTVKLEKLVDKRTDQLMETEEMLRRFLRYTKEGVAVSSSDNKIIDANDELLRILGYKKGELIGKYVRAFYSDQKEEKEIRDLMKRKGLVKNKDLHLLNKQGEERIVNTTAWADKDESGKVVRHVAVFRDVTERKEAEEELRKSEEKLRQVIENMPVMMNAFDEKGNFITWNRECERVTGYSADEIIGNPKALKLLYPDANDRKRIKEALPVRGFDSGHLEWNITCKDGSKKTLLSYNISKLFPVPGWYSWAVGVDITDRKRAEEALRESEERFRSVSAAIFAGIAIHDNARIIDANQALADMCGYELSEMTGMDGLKLAAPEWRKTVVENIRKGYEKPYEVVGIRKDGSTFHVEIVGKACRYQGRSVRITAFRNIDERKRAEQQIAVFQTLTENTIDAICMADLEGRVTYGNLACHKLFGYKHRSKEMYGVSITNFWPDEDAHILTEVVMPRAMTGFWRGEVRQKRKDGSLFDAFLTVFPLRDREGRLFRISAIIRDISDQKKAERALKNSEARYRTTIDSMKDAIHVVDKDLRIVLANKELKRWSRKFGLGTSVLGRKLLDIFQFLPGKVRKEYESVLRSGKALFAEEINTLKEREIVTETRKIPVFEDGKVTRIITILRDVTERKQAEKALRHRMELEKILTAISTRFINLPLDRVDSAINQALDVLGEVTGADRVHVYLLSDDGATMKNTHQWCAAGIGPAGEKAKDISAANFLWTMKKLKRFENIIVQRLADLPAQARPERARFKKHGIKSVAALPMALEGALLGFFSLDSIRTERRWVEEDIDILRIAAEIFASAIQRKKADERIRESEATANVLLNAGDDPMLLLKADGAVIAVNDVVTKHIGKSMDELKGTCIYDAFPPHVARVRRRASQRVIRSKRPYNFEDKLGTIICDTTVYPIFDKRGNVERLAVVARNIDEKRRLEVELRKSEERLQAVVSQVPGIAFITGVKDMGSVLYVSPRVEHYLGYSPEECIENRRIGEAVRPSEDMDAVTEDLAYFQKKKPKSYNFVRRFVHKNGRDVLWFDIRAEKVRDPATRKEYYYGLAVDITEQKKLEEQLLVSAKLASLGSFVAGIAHEINNPLASIKLDVQRLRKRALLAQEGDNILNTLDRISKIVQNLLKYARGQKAVLKQNKVSRIVDSALELVHERFAKEGKKIVRKFKRDIPLVFSDFGQLQQVFLNLALNACDAMKRRGTLEVESAYKPSSGVISVIFRDNGRGIPRKDLRKVFDPFFTTKATGTGLGLSISHKIIENHNGAIEFKSSPNRGTEVIISLPAAKE